MSGCEPKELATEPRLPVTQPSISPNQCSGSGSVWSHWRFWYSRIRIRIRTRMSRIRNTAPNSCTLLPVVVIVQQLWGGSGGVWAGGALPPLPESPRPPHRSHYTLLVPGRAYQATNNFHIAATNPGKPDPDSIRSVDPYPNSESVSGSRRAKMRTRVEKILFCSAGCVLLRAEGFFCSLGVFSGGQGIGRV